MTTEEAREAATSDQIDRGAIRARVEAATPGPWFVEQHGVMDKYRSRSIVLIGESEQDDADAAFIACARSEIPALLDALEAAEAERDALAEVFEDSYPMAYTEWIEVRNAWKRRAERAEALVSTLGSALREALLWGFRDGPRAALASYQEWDRANPSTGEAT